MKIFIDMGHGGGDPGAVGGGLREADLNLTLGHTLGAILIQQGHEVRYSRTGREKTKPSNAGRARAANEWGADFYLCLHFNASTSPKANGFLIEYAKGSGHGLALAIRIENLYNIKLGKDLKDGGVRQLSRNDRGGGLVWNPKAPAVIVETAFISNAHDRSIIKQSWFMDLAAHALANAVTG